MFITDNAETWQTSDAWREMAWQEAVRMTTDMRMDDGTLPDLRDVDLMLMGM